MAAADSASANSASTSTSASASASALESASSSALALAHEKSTSSFPPPSPILLGLCLAMAVTVCSSAGAVFTILTSSPLDVPPFLAASWRFWCQELMQLVPFLVSLRSSQSGRGIDDDHDDEGDDGNKENKCDLSAVESAERDAVGDEGKGRDGHEIDGVGVGVGVVGDIIHRSSRNESRGRRRTIGKTKRIETRGEDASDTRRGKPRRGGERERNIVPRFVHSIPLLAASGFFLGIHFAMWVYSLSHTSIIHSMLWVSMGPIVINGGSWVWYYCANIGRTGTGAVVVAVARDIVCHLVCVSASTDAVSAKVTRPSWQETAGTLTGLGGAVIMLLDVKRPYDLRPQSQNTTAADGTGYAAAVADDDDDENDIHLPTFVGDIAAFGGAVAVTIYLVIGRKLRAWMPVWMYAFPVVAFALVTNVVLAFVSYGGDNSNLANRATWAGQGRTSVFGFVNGRYFWLALYLGIGPGICGHTMLNALLKHLSPLTISTAMLAEPILGSFIGYVFGLQPIPGLCTFLGCIVLSVGLFLVVSGEGKSDDDDDDDEYRDECSRSTVESRHPIEYNESEQELICGGALDVVSTGVVAAADARTYGTLSNFGHGYGAVG